MKHVFKIERGLQVPDGTFVYPFLNPNDSTSGLALDLLDAYSIAAGDIAPYSASKVQVLLLASQVTFVLRGQLDLCVKDPDMADPYMYHLGAEEAALTRPGSFFQLINRTDGLCRVLYIVSPPYVFDIQDGQILYDDAVVLDEDWETLARMRWRTPALLYSSSRAEQRQTALDHIARRRSTA